MKTQVSTEFLNNYFAGQATALQKQVIDEWSKDEQNREIFFECLATWEVQNMQFTADVDAAKKRHQQRIIQQATHTTETFPFIPSNDSVKQPFFRITWFGWLIAASVSGLLLLTGIAFKNQFLYTTYRTAFGETRAFQLADGSQVTLNANSALRVPRFSFGHKTRHVVLAGEAEFSIKHTPDNQRFVVETAQNFEVVVLGTEFVVNTRDHGKKVVLNKGKVQLLYQEGQTSRKLTMKPGNLVTFDQKGHVSLRQTQHPQNYASWKSHRFVFEQTTLTELRYLFAENYGLQLQIPDRELTDWTISGAFTANNADELIDILSSASNLTYHRQGNTIVVSQEH
jgi:ferric-dicitrate binding protein FerR (iron transport regulator)